MLLLALGWNAVPWLPFDGGQRAPTPQELSQAQAQARVALEKVAQQAAEARLSHAAEDVLAAASGLNRGSFASEREIARVEAAVATLENVAPCTLAGGALLSALCDSSWRLIYSSSLAKLAGANSPLDIGPISQSFTASGGVVGLQDSVRLCMPAPWPLPRLQLLATFCHRLAAPGTPGSLTARLEEVRLWPLGLVGRRPGGRGVTLPAPRRLLTRMFGPASEESVLLPNMPGPVQELARYESGAGELTCTALVLDGQARVRVLRSALGDLRIFISEPGSEAAAATSGARGEGNAVGRLDAFGEPVEELWVEGVSDWGLDEAVSFGQP